MNALLLAASTLAIAASSTRTLIPIPTGAASLPKLQKGDAPQEPVSGREGAFALLAVRISPAGTIVDITHLGGLASIADVMRGYILRWRFEPARNAAGESLASTVLVAVVNRAPSLAGAVSPLPKALRPVEASPEHTFPPFPTRMVLPPVPAQARSSGVVLLEVAVDEEGRVASADVVRTSDFFDGIALDTIKRWEFDPATDGGEAVRGRAYVLFSFRPPLRPLER